MVKVMIKNHHTVKLKKISVRNTISKFNSLKIQAVLSDLAKKGRPSNIYDEDKTWLKKNLIKAQGLGYEKELWTT
jgi:hypothetical protein